MDYLVKTKAKNWKLNQLYSRYKEKCDNNLIAQSTLKSELNELIRSDLLNDKASKIIKGFLKKVDTQIPLYDRKNKGLEDKQQQSKPARSSSSAVQMTNTVKGSMNNFTYSGDINQQNNNIKNVASSSASASASATSKSSSKGKKRKVVDTTTDTESSSEEEAPPPAQSIKYLDYLEGGEPKVVIDSSTSNWCINEENISKSFHNYRNLCIDKISNTITSPTHIEELALNAIMWVEERNRRAYKISEENWSIVHRNIKDKYKDKDKPREYKDISIISEIIMTNDVKEGENQAAKHQAECANKGYTEELLRANTTLDIIQKLKKHNMYTVKEPLFCSLVVESLVCPFLCSNGTDIVLQGSTDESVGSKERRGKYGRIPDLSLLVQYNGHTALPFVCEVKSPSHMQSLNSTTDVQNPDFIKLANIMKDELDHMHFIEDKVVYGLLIEGFKCQLFVMDLLYYKLYRLTMLEQFYLPRDLYDIHALIPCLRRMDALEVCVIYAFFYFYSLLNFILFREL
ncbi:unnamed protein product [Mucor circinelloides]